MDELENSVRVLYDRRIEKGTKGKPVMNPSMMYSSMIWPMKKGLEKKPDVAEM